MFMRLLLLLLIASPLTAWSATSSFFTARLDLRRCPSPICGGLFVKSVNQPRTRCADGRLLAECYVASFDGSALNLNDEQLSRVLTQVQTGKAVIRGSLRQKNFGSPGTFGELAATEVWEAATDAPPTGGFYRVIDKGIRCITFPCLSFEGQLLNRTARRALAGVDLSRSGADEAKLQAASAQMAQPGGILVAGTQRRVTGPAGRALELVGSQFYLPVSPALPQACYVGGCSGQICSDQPGAISTCEFLPEYACYQTASCARQSTGRCGWTPSAELTSCLENARRQNPGTQPQ